MDTGAQIVLTAAFFISALLYSSVGHAGASGYLTAMALVGFDPALMRPTALILNILVASIASYKFFRAGAFSWRIFFPFAVTSIPFSWIGGSIILPGSVYQVILGVILIYASVRMLLTIGEVEHLPTPMPPLVPALAMGAVIGLISGLTGTGGGIFLTPLLLLARWSSVRQAAGISAFFILVNSVAGLFGQLDSLSSLPAALPIWLVVVAVGGWLGAEYGSRHGTTKQIRYLLAIVMVIAAVKLMGD